MPDPTTAITWGTIGALITLIAGAAAVVKKLWPAARMVTEFLGDWRGEPARPGRDAIPGVMDRLVSAADQAEHARAEAIAAREAAHAARDAATDNALATAAIGAQLGVIVDAVAQLQPNGGAHLSDVIRRIEADTAAVAGRTIPAHHSADTRGGTP